MVFEKKPLKPVVIQFSRSCDRRLVVRD